MHLRRHDWAECPACGSRLWYGLKQEPTGWKVHYECSDCSFEKRVGWIAMSDVGNRDDAAQRAKEMGVKP